jgi:hypothetical protein
MSDINNNQVDKEMYDLLYYSDEQIDKLLIKCRPINIFKHFVLISEQYLNEVNQTGRLRKFSCNECSQVIIFVLMLLTKFSIFKYIFF